MVIILKIEMWGLLKALVLHSQKDAYNLKALLIIKSLHKCFGYLHELATWLQ